MSDVVIAGAKRTAIGSFLGQFTGVPTPTLGATAIRAANNGPPGCFGRIFLAFAA